ncbi:3'(2'),5'-bisphosphate nucleotidase CysQ [Hansschlegelia quercus]|uniref:3'(2'),5'-bisphosphate nucleotidase CysQ n=1 Tax=Hansschlegelia quercus TaxID=2528245 RepID=A0A4Q9GNE5_9HYPH|nr:3'(2'),5'-bisphosphate nucleotidase CysQ [Hansschlegelia quercus]TBN55011.1 3'(2'),5'-bisphosphate nucleotidase CysQ [Hansschlegelia quercus]
MATPSATIDLERLSDPLAEIVREAGAIALGYFKSGAERWTKADDSPVTEADIAVDRFLAARLPELAPGAGWLSEETADTTERLDKRLTWVVDPIDGTRAFIEGAPEWVVSVALVEDGQPVVGMVFDPCNDIAFIATRGGGAFRNGVRMATPNPAELSGAKVGGPQALLGPLKSYGVQKGRWHYALANRLVKVAAGDLDAALARPNAHDWDIAAAHLILEEAGAKLTGFDGAAPTYNRPTTRHGGLIAAPPARAQALKDALHAERDALDALEPYR